MKLSVFNIKKFLIFSQKNFFIYILGNGNPKNLLYSMRQNFLIFQEVTFWGRKSKTPTLKNVLIYQEIELSSLKFKTHFILQEKVAKSEKIKFIILLKKKKKKKNSLFWNSLHHFYKLNKTVLLGYKNFHLKSFISVELFLSFFSDFWIIYNFIINFFYYFANFFSNCHICSHLVSSEYSEYLLYILISGKNMHKGQVLWLSL